ncbi:MAG TPA: RDD family protein [Steroidobacteraceae bacterium]|nr:RDD family protein [Steroidobacteraceae bacterium]
MNTSTLQRLGFLFTLLCLTAVAVHPGAAAAAAAARSATAAPGTAAPSTAAPANDDHASATTPADSSDDEFNDDTDRDDRSDWRNRMEAHRRRNRQHHAEGDIVSIGHSSHLESGQKADSVVSVFGSSTSDGEAGDVVSVIGNTHVTGPVGDTAVAVMGNVYVDAKVNGDVVAVLGNVELGPNAEIGGDVVAVMGTLTRDPAAVVHGSVQRVIDMDIGGARGFSGLNTWITHCLLLGRPLAFTAGIGWAWTLALGLLVFYACLALMFRHGIDQCVQTLESQPGHTALAALLGILLTPVLLILLCVTVIGIAAVPFVVAALFCMSLFGKAVMLAWIGGRITGRRAGAAGLPARGGHPAVAVLIGGAVVLVLYVVPILGFLVYKLLGFFGFGAVLYTLVLRVRARRAGGTPPSVIAGADPVSANNPPPNSSAAMAGPGWTASAAPAAGAAAAAAATPNAAAEPFASGPPPSAAPPSAPPSAAGASMSPQITAALPRAGFWVRMGALFLDILLVGFATSLLHSFGDHHFLGDFHIVVLAIYGAVMWKLRGTTVGGIVFDLHVVRVDGRPLDWETAIVRALGCFLSLAVVFLGFIWIAFDDNHQAWHDKIAGTVVVRAKRGAL